MGRYREGGRERLLVVRSINSRAEVRSAIFHADSFRSALRAISVLVMSIMEMIIIIMDDRIVYITICHCVHFH